MPHFQKLLRNDNYGGEVVDTIPPPVHCMPYVSIVERLEVNLWMAKKADTRAKPNHSLRVGFS
jgi:hypothetical protein